MLLHPEAAVAEVLGALAETPHGIDRRVLSELGDAQPHAGHNSAPSNEAPLAHDLYLPVDPLLEQRRGARCELGVS